MLFRLVQSFVPQRWLIEIENNVLTSNEMRWGNKGLLTKRLGLLREAIRYKKIFAVGKKNRSVLLGE